MMTKIQTLNQVAPAVTFRKSLGFWSLFSVALGLVISQGVMVLMLTGTGIAGAGYLIALLLGYILALTYVASFSELALMMPKSGSVSYYTDVAMGSFPAIISVYSGYVAVAAFALPAELLLIDELLQLILPNVLPPFTFGIGLLAFLTIMNLLGIDAFARLQNVLAFSMIVVLVVLGIGSNLGVANAMPSELHPWQGWNPLGLGVMSLVAISVWGFVGAEFVCPLVEESQQPERNVPKAMYSSVSVIFIIIALYCLGALNYVSTDMLSNDTLPHYAFVKSAFGESGLIYLLLVAIAATCSTVNTSLAAIPRMLYGMAENQQSFPILKTLSKRTNVPWVGVLFIALVSALPMIVLKNKPGVITNLLLAAAVCWLVTYIIAHINVIILRKRYPDYKRPYKTPFYPWPQIVGILGMSYAIYYASPSPDDSVFIFGAAGGLLAFFAIVSFFWVRFFMQRGLFEPKSIHSLTETVTPRSSHETTN